MKSLVRISISIKFYFFMRFENGRGEHLLFNCSPYCLPSIWSCGPASQQYVDWHFLFCSRISRTRGFSPYLGHLWNKFARISRPYLATRVSFSFSVSDWHFPSLQHFASQHRVIKSYDFLRADSVNPRGLISKKKSRAFANLDDYFMRLREQRVEI